MRKVVMSLGVSLDGYIADQNGGYEWIQGDGNKDLDTDNTFDFEAFLNSKDMIIMGRKAYEDCPMEMFKDHQLVVLTHEARPNHDNVEYFSGDLAEMIQLEKSKTGKDIYVYGGAHVVYPLLKADLIDEYVIGIIPMILGSGRKLFIGEHKPIPLTLTDYSIMEGQVIAHYKRR